MWKSYEKNINLLTIILVMTLAVFIFEIFTGQEQIQQDIGKVQENIKILEAKIESLEGRIDELENELKKWSVYEITAYAPLDSRAHEGICFAGNPHVTASGAPTVPGITVAAGKELPFGTEIYIRGLGRRVVQDRGGTVGYGKLDIAVSSKSEALRWGRRYIPVRIDWEEE